MALYTKVNIQDLRTAGDGLRAVATEFEGLERLMDAYDDTVGHRKLADKLRDFSDSWNDNREKMIESVKGLGEAATTAGRTYEEIETQLVNALLGKGGGQ